MLNGPDSSNEKLQKKKKKKKKKKKNHQEGHLHLCWITRLCINSNAMFEIPALKHNKVI